MENTPRRSLEGILSMRLFYLLMIMALLASSVDSAHAVEAGAWHKFDVQSPLQN